MLTSFNVIAVCHSVVNVGSWYRAVLNVRYYTFEAMNTKREKDQIREETIKSKLGHSVQHRSVNQ